LALLPFLLPAHLRAQTAAATGAIVEGEVVNAATSVPIAGAHLKLDPGQGEPLYLKSDAEGRFLFRNVALASYSVSVEAPGFLRPTYPLYLDLTGPRQSSICPATGCGHAPADPFDISADADGTPHARISIPLTAYAVVTGKVTDPDGVALEGWTVQILVKQPVPKTGNSGSFANPLPGGRDEINTKASAVTNDKGEFRAARLEPGTYYLMATKPAFAATESRYRATYYPHTLDVASAKTLELAAGDRASANIQIAGRSGIRIGGHLEMPAATEDAGSPSRYSILVLAPKDDHLAGTYGPVAVLKDEYEFNDVLPGSYILMAVTREASGDPFGGSHKAVFGLMRSIETGDSDRNVGDLVLQPVRDLAGTVNFGRGCGPLPVTIHASSSSPIGGGQVEAASGADGTFVLRGLGVGSYTVSLSRPGQFVQAASMRLGDRDVAAEGFESPLLNDEPLRIDVACGSSGGRR
jgi:hypothetical protein